MRPLLFLDVDGPLIPFGGSAPHPAYAPEPPSDAHPLLYRVDPDHGRRLVALGCELVWATTWGQEANEVLAPRLGLPPLPVVDWPDDEDDEDEGDEGDEGEGDEGEGDEGGPARLHWKTRALSGRAAGRSYVWLDDEITGADRAWVRAHHPAPALLHRVDPAKGLTAADYATVAAWAAEYGAQAE
ncbi:HAD domain-containing protein [Streptomyces sp. NPDC012769]|uniref:HAD domain-containing protein n=1 Tax=Streptomyces sp. NPDC012769 TaxID=3364848 RepID=UPI00367D111F